MKATSKSHLFKRAYAIKSLTGKTFPVCLSHAWAIERLIRQLRERVVIFVYEKTDGTVRKARGTLKDRQPLRRHTGAPSYRKVAYYDLDEKAVRSFRVDHLITVCQ